jgi:hypothetical protein
MLGMLRHAIEGNHCDGPYLACVVLVFGCIALREGTSSIP